MSRVVSADSKTKKICGMFIWFKVVHVLMWGDARRLLLISKHTIIVVLEKYDRK